MSRERTQAGDYLRVLHFTNTVTRAGVEEHILTLLRGLDRRYFRLMLACMPELAEKLRPDLPPDVELIEIRLEGPRDWRGAWQLRSLLQSWRPHVLHSHMFQSSRCASPLARLCKIPFVVETPHGREAWRKGWLKGSFVIDRAVGRCVNRFIAVGEAQREYLLGVKGLPPEKVVVIFNGVDVHRFNPELTSPRRSRELRASLGLSDEDPIIVVLARLENQKGHHVLLDALPEVRREFPRVRVICVGDGILREELRQRARALGVEENVRFVGYKENPEEWLFLADFTVLSSHFEGLPIAAIESLAMERAVVATAVDGTAEVVVNGKTGLTVPPGQPARLTEAICRMLADGNLRREMGKAGRAWVKQYFSQEEQVCRTGELYLEGLGCRSDTIGYRKVPTRPSVQTGTAKRSDHSVCPK